jgi:hypothetical protein
MTIAALLQDAVVALAVLWAAGMAFGKLMPRLRTRAVRALLRQLQAPSRPRWLRNLALRLQPPPDQASGCGSGCSSCDSCGSPSAPAAGSEQPLKFLPKK